MISNEIFLQRLSLPLEVKIRMAKQRIREFHKKMEGQTYISFSGGKDSTVLLHLVRDIYPETVATFSDTGLEYPEIKEFVKSIDNVDIIRPTCTFKDVIEKQGWPILSKQTARRLRVIRECSKYSSSYISAVYGRSKGKYNIRNKVPNKWLYLVDAPFKISEQCCYYLKKAPFKKYNRKTGMVPYLGMMANESTMRRLQYLTYGCNSYGSKTSSNPLSFWTDEDIWNYIHKYDLEYSKIYDMGYRRTGCMFCAFGAHLELEPNRFQRMKETHPQLWNYCINVLGEGEVLKAIGVKYEND